MRLSPVFSGADLEPAYLPLLRVWILRALVHCNGAANFLSSRGFNDAVLPGFLGFSQADRDDYCPRRCRSDAAPVLIARAAIHSRTRSATRSTALRSARSRLRETCPKIRRAAP